MDKFGVFNLLNSFLNMNKQTADAVKNNDDASSPLNNLLSALTSGLKNSPAPQKNTATAKPNNISTAPLQSSMLNTMTSHDEFVKRVKEKNKA